MPDKNQILASNLIKNQNHKLCAKLNSSPILKISSENIERTEICAIV